MNKMKITVESGLSADGFDVTIFNEEKAAAMRSYRYGRNASYNEGNATEKAPYVSNILQSLIDEYQVGTFTVEPGRNMFVGKPVSDECVDEFKTNHCSNLALTEMKEEEPFLLTEADLDRLWAEAGMAAKEPEL